MTDATSMRIMFDHQIFGAQKYGGISRYFYELSNHLANCGHQDVEIFAPLYINEYFASDARVRPRGFKIPQLPRSRRITEAVNAMATRLLVKPARSIDIYHETYYSGTDNAPFSAKRILTVFDMIHERFRDGFMRNDQVYKAKAAAAHRADHIICISHKTQQDLIELLDVDVAKTSVIHLGFALPQQGAVEQSVAPASRPYLLHVGLRAEYKNFERVARAYAASPSLRKDYDLVCFGGGAFTSEEIELFRELAIAEPAVRHVAGDDLALAACYRAAAAFVYPSLYEGFGLPPLEAMSFDCPVVCSNVTSIPEVVGDAAELFDPYDVDAIRHAIERVTDNPARQAQLIALGRARVQLFSWEKCARETLEAYSQSLS